MRATQGRLRGSVSGDAGVDATVPDSGFTSPGSGCSGMGGGGGGADSFTGPRDDDQTRDCQSR